MQKLGRKTMGMNDSENDGEDLTMTEKETGD